MHRRIDLWGPDGMWSFGFLSPLSVLSEQLILAAQFDPNRFLDSRLHKVFQTSLLGSTTLTLPPRKKVPHP